MSKNQSWVDSAIFLDVFEVWLKDTLSSGQTWGFSDDT